MPPDFIPATDSTPDFIPEAQASDSGDKPGFFRGVADTTIKPLGALASSVKDYGVLKTLGEVANPFSLGVNPDNPVAKIITGMVAGAHQHANQAATEYGQQRYFEAFGDALAAAIPGVGPAAAQAARDIADPEKRSYGAGEAAGLIGSVLLPTGKGKLGAAADEVRTGVKVAGKEFPATAGELAREGSGLGIVDQILKRSIVGGAVKKIAPAQQQFVRELFNDMAQNIGGVAGSPDNFLQTIDANAEALGAQTSQLYDSTIARAKQAGLKVPVPADALDKTMTTSGNYGKVPDFPVALDEALQLRSKLSKAAFKTSDLNAKRILVDKVEAIDEGIDSSLTNAAKKGGDALQLANDVRQARSQWSQYRALQDVRDDISSATEGIQPMQQAAGAAGRPQAISAGNLLEKLKGGGDDFGRLRTAFGPEAAGDIVQTLDLMKRNQGAASALGMKTGGFFLANYPAMHILWGVASGSAHQITAGTIALVGMNVTSRLMASPAGRAVLKIGLKTAAEGGDLTPVLQRASLALQQQEHQGN